MERNPTHERRVGARRTVVGRFGWLAPFTRSWRARRRERDLPPVAIVENLSMTGARLVVPRTEGLVVGAMAQVEAVGHHGSVEVRWVHDHDDPQRARVGVEFHALSAALERRIQDLLAEDRKEEVDWRWEIAR